MAYSTIPIDDAVNAAIFINNEHHEIHEGDAYYITYVATGVASGSNADLLLLPPNTTTRCHLVWSVDTNEETEFYLYEAGNVTGGTAVTAYNHDRNSANAATLAVTHTPTVTTTGTLIYHNYQGLTGGTTHFGSQERREQEMIMKQNTTYLFRVTSRGAGNDISIYISWYEHA